MKKNSGDNNFNLLMNNVEIDIVNLTTEQYKAQETDVLVNTSDKPEENNSLQVIQISMKRLKEARGGVLMYFLTTISGDHW